MPSTEAIFFGASAAGLKDKIPNSANTTNAFNLIMRVSIVRRSARIQANCGANRRNEELQWEVMVEALGLGCKLGYLIL
jgi:hypothetical protein